MDQRLKILFPTDFSPSSRTAFETLNILKKIYNIDLSLIHVLISSWNDLASNDFYQIEVMQRLEVWQKEFGHANNPKKLYLEIGNAAEAIIQTANNQKIELILLGGKSSNQQGRYKTGATVEAVVRYARQSVWIATSTVLSKVICGVDGSVSSAKALKKAIELCQNFSAKLCVVSVISSLDFNPLAITDKEIVSAEEKFRKQTIQTMRAFIKDFNVSANRSRIHLSLGNARQCHFRYG